MSDEEEEWIPVVGWEGLYEVSSFGRVRSLPRYWDNPLTGGKSKLGGNILRSTSSEKYVSVMLNPGKKTVNIHRLVCEAFHGPAPEGKNLVLHSDDNGQNNHEDNLRWGDGADNTEDQFKNRGPNHNSLKTHCSRGHEYTEGNTYLHVKERTTSRICRTCQKMHDEKRNGRVLSDDDPRHGTDNGYFRFRCRCEPCKLAGQPGLRRRNENQRLRRKRKKDLS